VIPYRKKKYPVVMTKAGGSHGEHVPCVPGLGSLPEPTHPSFLSGKPLSLKTRRHSSPAVPLVLMGSIQTPNGVTEVNKEGKTWMEMPFDEVLSHIT